ncbi:MAG: M1 family peptidase, partial [Bacteroidetes bacterium]|nr:M1 family peptidase [Bacteroidota bacterium]
LLNPNSYEKGSWVLHMLRRRIGDQLFWKGISAYYATYRNKNATSADFETIMSAVSGQDLHAFFHQWLDQPGHPVLRLQHSYDRDKKELTLTFIQAGDYLYTFPLEYTLDGASYTTTIKTRNTTVHIPLAAEPARIRLDPHVNTLFSTF